LSADTKTTRASLELTAAAAIWGFGFVSTIWALVAVGPLWLTTLRFLLAAVFTILLLALARLVLRHKDVSPIALWAPQEFHRAFFPGAFIGLAITFQTKGLLFTTASRSGFITTLYVIFVPILERVFFSKKIHRAHALWVFLALLGTAMICQLHTQGMPQSGQWLTGAIFGDSLTLIASVLAAGQIISVGRAASQVRSPFRFNAYQSLWAGLLTLPFAILIEGGPGAMIDRLWSKGDFKILIAGVLFLTLGSSVLAFYLQVRSQRLLRSSTASMICLLESPFAAFFGWLILSESFDRVQSLGAAILMISVVGSVLLETQKPATVVEQIQS
jgi:drug/metabolite transporter (DMT)-like permease